MVPSIYLFKNAHASSTRSLEQHVLLKIDQYVLSNSEDRLVPNWQPSTEEVRELTPFLGTKIRILTCSRITFISYPIDMLEVTQICRLAKYVSSKDRLVATPRVFKVLIWSLSY
jgi:hypothetical protein